MHPEQLGCAINHFSAPHFSAVILALLGTGAEDRSHAVDWNQKPMGPRISPMTRMKTNSLRLCVFAPLREVIPPTHDNSKDSVLDQRRSPDKKNSRQGAKSQRQISVTPGFQDRFPMRLISKDQKGKRKSIQPTD
ncbi:MAG TPA: hypothetical protein VGH74_15700 [Planctomycetaceae bacterium]|jgi:hypothetical protein